MGQREAISESRRIGDVEDALEAVAPEPLAQARVVLAIAGDGLDTRGEALGSRAAIEHGDLMTAQEELLDETEADEFRAADHEGAHDARILA